MMAPKKPTKEELAEQVRRLKEELRELRKPSSEPPAGAEGVAEGIVTDLGKMIPGLQKLIDVASGVPEFRERLASIDEEIKRKFKEQPLRRASQEMTGGIGRRPMGIPPGVRRGRPGRPVSTRTGSVWSSRKPPARGKRGKPGPPKVRISPETPDQLPVDVFDEGDKLVVLAEATGLKLGHIAVSLEGTVLVVSVDAPQAKGVQRVKLPCEVAGQPKVSLAKGILKIQVSKADKQ
jgi:HSP20 family molecular chaperone IbpA